MKRKIAYVGYEGRRKIRAVVSSKPVIEDSGLDTLMLIFESSESMITLWMWVGKPQQERLRGACL